MNHDAERCRIRERPHRLGGSGRSGTTLRAPPKLAQTNVIQVLVGTVLVAVNELSPIPRWRRPEVL